jgi:hypothetical protein
MTAVENSAQQDVLQYLLPVCAVTTALAAPLIMFWALGRKPVDEVKAAIGRPLSLISLVITLLSPVFLISNYAETTLVQYAVYSILLSQATIMADLMTKRRALPPLLVWHSINLLNLIGGTFSSLLQIYSTSNAGLIMTIYNIATAGDCPDGAAAVNYCSDGWIAVQLLAGFIYIVLHILAFFTVLMRVTKVYGGEEAKSMDSVVPVGTP